MPTSRKSCRSWLAKFEIATEVRGVGAIQALQLSIPGKPVLEGALADGLLINVTQDSVLRFLPPFLLEEKHVDAGIRILKRQLAAAQKQHKAELKAAKSGSPPRQPKIAVNVFLRQLNFRTRVIGEVFCRLSAMEFDSASVAGV